MRGLLEIGVTMEGSVGPTQIIGEDENDGWAERGGRGGLECEEEHP